MKYRLLAALAAMCWSSAQADVRGLQIEDLVRMERVGAPLLSPDGKSAVHRACDGHGKKPWRHESVDAGSEQAG
jgi:hypothetical protein